MREPMDVLRGGWHTRIRVSVQTLIRMNTF